MTQLENTIKNLKENFQVLLGWSYNDSPEIGSLTDVDENEIAAMNPDTDLAQAIENNYTLKINERKLENAKNETVKNQLTTAIVNNKKQIGRIFYRRLQKGAFSPDLFTAGPDKSTVGADQSFQCSFKDGSRNDD